MADLRPVRGTRDFLPDDSRRRRHVETDRRDGRRPLRLRRDRHADLRVHRGVRNGRSATPPTSSPRRCTRSPIATARASPCARRTPPASSAPSSRTASASGCRCAPTTRGRCSATSGRRRAGSASSTRSASSSSGVADPLADVEVILLASDVLGALGLGRPGDARDQHPRRRARAAPPTAPFSSTISRRTRTTLSDDSRVRLGRNPLRVLDSKDEADRGVIAERTAPRRSPERGIAAILRRRVRRPRRRRHLLPAQSPARSRPRLLLPHRLRVRHRRPRRAGHGARRRPLRRPRRADGRAADARHRLGRRCRAPDAAGRGRGAGAGPADRPLAARPGAGRRRPCGSPSGCAPPAIASSSPSAAASASR